MIKRLLLILPVIMVIIFTGCETDTIDKVNDQQSESPVVRWNPNRTFAFPPENFSIPTMLRNFKYESMYDTSRFPFYKNLRAFDLSEEVYYTYVASQIFYEFPLLKLFAYHAHNNFREQFEVGIDTSLKGTTEAVAHIAFGIFFKDTRAFSTYVLAHEILHLVHKYVYNYPDDYNYVLNYEYEIDLILDVLEGLRDGFNFSYRKPKAGAGYVDFKIPLRGLVDKGWYVTIDEVKEFYDYWFIKNYRSLKLEQSRPDFIPEMLYYIIKYSNTYK